MFIDIVNAMATAIQSSPIVYVRHHDYALIDSVIMEALGGVLRKDKPEFKVAEFEQGVGQVGFAKKNDLRDKFEDLDKFVDDIVFQHALERKGFELFLIRNSQSIVATDPGMQSRLLLFAEQYSKGLAIDKDLPFNPCKTVILVDPSRERDLLPSGLAKYVTAIDIPVPENEEIREMIHNTDPKLDKAGTETLIRTLKGLDRSDIAHILSSITTWSAGTITLESFNDALKEKKQIAKKSGVVEVVEANESFANIGGMDVLRENLSQKAIVFRELNRADKYKVPIPKGVLIIGMPGCGKSMIAKAIAHEFRAPLLRLDMNRILGSFVGESEKNMHRALDAAETASPCILWIDEIEKAFSGTNNAGGNNDDTVMRMMGIFLTWLQEHTAPVFIVATANDEMRSEFMRKGRFDDVFFVNWPNDKEREAIFRKQIEWFDEQTDFDFSQLFAKNGSGEYELEDKHRVVLKAIIKESEGFTGSEINSALKTVLERMFVSALEGHEEHYELSLSDKTVTPERVISVLKEMQPHRLSKQDDGTDGDSTVKRLAKLRKSYTSASKL